METVERPEDVIGYRMPTNTVRLNLGGAPVTVGFLAQVATELEKGGPVFIEHAALPANGPGLTAFRLGYEYRKAEEAREETEANGN